MIQRRMLLSPLTGVSGEERRAVVNLGDAAPCRGAVLHLREHVCQEQHLTITGAGDERVLGITAVFDQKARILDVRLAAQAFQVTLPALAVGRIGEHEVEFAGRKGVIGERRVFRPPDDVVSGFRPRP